MPVGIIFKEIRNKRGIYEDKKQVILPNPLSSDKSIVRTTLIPSLMNVYDYNVSHGTSDVSIYEISKTYDNKYNEVSKVTGLLSGNCIIPKLDVNSSYIFLILKK